MSETVLQISLEKIIPHPDNRRVGGFDPVKLEQLADSIREVGVQQPIIVRERNSTALNSPEPYELVAGERRWRAAKLAGLTEIPAIARELDDLQVLKIQTVENLQREDVHPLDEADGFARLIEKAGYEVEQIAQELGKSASYVYQRLKLRDLSEPVRDLFAEGKLTAGHAILIARLPEKQQGDVLEWMFQGYRAQDEIDTSVRDLEEYISREILMDLNKVSWKKDDANLLPEAGPCTLCPKRTGNHAALFADVSNGGKKDYCLDRSCFVAKVKAIVEQRKAELKDEPRLLMTEYYTNDRSTVSKYDVKGCKKGEPGAVRVLNVDTGNIAWGKTTEFARPPATALGPAQREKLSKERAKTILENKVRRLSHRRVWDQVMAAAEAHPGLKKNLLPLPVLQMAAEIMLRSNWTHRNMIEKECGHLSPTSEYSELLLWLVRVLAAQGLNPDAWDLADVKTLAKHYKVDIAAIERQVKAELTKPSKGTAVKKGTGKKRDPEYVEMLAEEEEEA